MTAIHQFPLVEGQYATYDLQDLSKRLVDRATAYGSEMEVSTDKSKIMTNSTNNISADISTNGQKLEEVTSFKYLVATLCKDGTCSAEVRIRIASAVAAMARLKQRHGGSTPSASQASSNSASLLSPPPSSTAVKHGPCLLTLRKGSRLSKLSARGKFSVSATWSTNRRLGAEQDQRTCGFTGTSLLATVKRRKLARFGDIRRQDSLSKIILQGTLEGGQRRGRQRRCWMDNIKELASLLVPELLTKTSCIKRLGEVLS